MPQYENENQFMQAIQCALEAGKEICTIYQSNDFDIELKTDHSPLTRADRKSHEVITHGLEQTSVPVLSEEAQAISWNDRSDWNRFWLVDPLDGTKEFIKRNGEFTVNIALIEYGRPVIGIIYSPVPKTLYFALKGVGSFRFEAFGSGVLPVSLDEWLEHSTRLPVYSAHSHIRAVVSRSHQSEETVHYLNKLGHEFGPIQHTSAGSSLKLCLIAEGNAEIYPRMGPTMEWDIAAGDIIISESGGSLVQTDGSPIAYNKKDLHNPWFVARSSGFLKTAASKG